MTSQKTDTNSPVISPLVDNYGRQIKYLRLAVTDRCNLRCTYCMPDKGRHFVPYPETMRYEEMLRLVRLFSRLGISKVRITGGEPFTKKDILSFLGQLKNISGIEHLHITTNGVKVAQLLDALQKIGISGINLSLDTLNRHRFWKLTGHNSIDRVMATFFGALERTIPLKINTVVLHDTTDHDLLDMVDLARQYPVTVRFIEPMPFSGGNGIKNGRSGDLAKRISRLLPLNEINLTEPTTARLFTLPGHTGMIGIIEGHSRKFCSSCNKIRITPLGVLKTCLYDAGVLNLKEMVRSGSSDEELYRSIKSCIAQRHENGHQAEHQYCLEREPSMASIGG